MLSDFGSFSNIVKLGVEVFTRVSKSALWISNTYVHICIVRFFLNINEPRRNMDSLYSDFR